MTTDLIGGALDHLDPPASPYRTDPVGWVNDTLGEHLWSKQREIAESLATNRYTAVQSCHDAGKSFIASRLAAWWIAVHPPGEAFVVTTAPTHAQVDAILWREIGKAHRAGGLPGRVIRSPYPQWLHGDELVAYGRKPADHDQDAFQGIHARYVLIVVDEACGVPKGLFDAVDALATNEHARVLAIGNPDDPGSHFAQVCKPGSGWHTIRIDGLETPNFTDEPIPEALRELLLSPTWVEERRKRWGEDSPLYIAKVRGKFPEVSDDTLIPYGHITRAQQRDIPSIEATEPPVTAVDVARFGSDDTVIGVRWGGRFRIVASHSRKPTTETTGAAIRVHREHGSGEIRVDADGVGGGVVDRLAEQRHPVVGMHSGQAALDTETFANARAEWWWGLRQRFEDDDIDIDPDDDELAAQLAQIRYRYTSRGQVVIESKDDMRKRGIGSPDRADTAMLAFAHVPDDPDDVEYEAEFDYGLM